MDALREGFGTGLLHLRHPFRQHGAEDLHHLAVAVRHSAQLATHPLDSGGQHPVLERGAVSQGAGLAGQAGAREPRTWAIDVFTGLCISAPVFWVFTQFLAINLPGLTGTGWL